MYNGSSHVLHAPTVADDAAAARNPLFLRNSTAREILLNRGMI
jgi:hypothetical protein